MWQTVVRFIFGAKSKAKHKNKVHVAADVPRTSSSSNDDDDEDEMEWQHAVLATQEECYDDTYIESDEEEESQGYMVTAPKPKRPPPVVARIKDFLAPSLKAKLPTQAIVKKRWKKKKKGKGANAGNDKPRKAPLPAAAKQRRKKPRKKQKYIQQVPQDGRDKEFEVARRLVEADAKPFGYEYDYGNSEEGEEWYDDQYIPSDDEEEDGEYEEYEEEEPIEEESKPVAKYFSFTWTKQLPSGVATVSPSKPSAATATASAEEQEEAKDDEPAEREREKRPTDDHVHFSVTFEHRTGGDWKN